MEIMWKGEKVSRFARRKLRRMINAAQKWTLLTVAFTGKVKKKWVKQKVIYTLHAGRKIF